MHWCGRFKTDMRYRQFGRVGWQVSEIGYGMWGMGSWSGSDDQQSLESLQAAVDLGCNFFDTAYAYGEGHSEKLLGQTVRANPRRAPLTPRRRSRRRISSGRRRRSPLSKSLIRRTTLKSMCIAVLEMPTCKVSI